MTDAPEPRPRRRAREGGIPVSELLRQAGVTADGPSTGARREAAGIPAPAPAPSPPDRVPRVAPRIASASWEAPQRRRASFEPDPYERALDEPVPDDPALHEYEPYEPESEEELAAEPPAEADRTARRRARRSRATLALGLVLVVVLVAVGYLGYSKLWPRFSGPGDYDGDGHGVVIVQVHAGDTATQIGQALEGAGAVRSVVAFTRAAAAIPAMSSIQPGFYQVRSEMSGRAAAERLVSPAARVGHVEVTGGQNLEDVHVAGGRSVPGIYSVIARSSCVDDDGRQRCVSADDLRRAAAETPLDELGVPAWARTAVGAAPDANRRLEGLIVAGTYHVDPTMTPQRIIRALLEASGRTLDGLGITAPHPDATGLTDPYQFLVGASLVEREAAKDEDFARVARVILNRLGEGKKLEFDSTVNYDVRAQSVGTSTSDRARDTPWNTYMRTGLPATPIASPSPRALQGMERPAPGDWLYFVTVDRQGTTVFNRDFEAHQRATEDAHRNGVFDRGN